jgi:hypothetical protein
MKLGKISFFFALFCINFSISSYAEEKITSIPLVNLENLEASFENEDTKKQNVLNKENLFLKEKKIKESQNKSIKVNIVGLDKITAKTSDISLSLGKPKKFGLIEIKVLKCENVESQPEQGQVAYVQVKDLSDNASDQVFVFNGWTFSSSTTLNPLDHPVYDFWLISCENV